jgi:hypothetical protein
MLLSLRLLMHRRHAQYRLLLQRHILSFANDLYKTAFQKMDMI